MTIGCTRCGASCEGDIILPALSFGFKHNEGCGHGVGPLAVLPGNKSPPKVKEVKHEDVKIEEKKEKVKVFGNNNFNNKANKEKRFG